MRRARLALPLVLTALASGCAGASSATDFEGEEQRVADAVERLQTAGESGDAREICDELLAPSLREEMAAGGENCEQELDKALQDADDFDLEVEDVTVSGNEATARVRGREADAERVREIELVREGDDWRLTNLGT
jgi:hypothetical protein